MSSSAATGVPRGWAVHRSVTLLRVFLLASAVILISGAVALGAVLTAALRGQALDDTRTRVTEYVDGVLRPQVVQGDRIHVSPHLPRQIDEQLQRQPDIVSVKVWRPDGVLVWTNLAQERIGKKFSLEGELGETIGENKAHASISKLDEEENEAEQRAVDNRRVFEVYAPLESNDGKHAIGAYEIYAKPQHTEAFIASRKRLIWAAIVAVFLTLYGALALLVRNASSTLRRQAATLQSRSRELLDSYRRLEESSLEAIESLSATVDAKDPCTAGHAAVVAELVSHVSRLHEAVPLIRHHHERWDGKGYPDRLAGDEIPQEACVVGLADAWDAMTTDRPYREALSVEQAAAEVRACRGTQFSPEVVDAFFSAFRRHPAVFEPDEPDEPYEI